MYYAIVYAGADTPFAVNLGQSAFDEIKEKFPQAITELNDRWTIVRGDKQMHVFKEIPPIPTSPRDTESPKSVRVM